MATEKPNPTMKDVAQEAGVALGTVSKVVNGIPVGEEYRVRVEKAIKKLGYRVNIYARGLRNERTRTIQVIIPNLTNPFFAELVHHITKELAQKDYKTMLCMTDGDPSLEQTHILMAKQHMADGIIYNGPHNPDHGWKKDRERGRINKSKERGNKPWREQRTARSSKQNWYWRY